MKPVEMIAMIFQAMPVSFENREKVFARVREIVRRRREGNQDFSRGWATLDTPEEARARIIAELAIYEKEAWLDDELLSNWLKEAWNLEHEWRNLHSRIDQMEWYDVAARARGGR